MTRGRLIWAFTANIAPLDTAATEANAGSLPSGYDYDFKEPVQFADGTESLTYATEIGAPCQVETERDSFERLRMMNLGDNEQTEAKLVFHYEWLEDNGHVDADGRVTFPKKGDRLMSILDQLSIVTDDFSGSEIVVTEARPESYGLSGGRRNLLIVTFKKRDTATAEV